MACNLRNLFKCVQGLRKSTSSETLQDRIYKLKDGTLNHTKRKSPSPTKIDGGMADLEQTSINKPLHTDGLPMLPRQGNKTTQK